MASVLRTTFRTFIRNQILRQQSRTLHTSRNYAAEDLMQDTPGQTSVTILNEETDGQLMIDAFSPVGFKLNSGLRVMGPCVLFPRSVLHWNIRGVKDINEDSLSLFTVLEPKPDVLIIGVGEKENLSLLDRKIIQYLRSKKINLELLPTESALATFNFLNAEHRYVAGAFIPPAYVETTQEDDVWNTMYEHGINPFDLGSDFLRLDKSDEELDDYELYEQQEKELKQKMKDKKYGEFEEEKKRQGKDPKEPDRYIE